MATYLFIGTILPLLVSLVATQDITEKCFGYYLAPDGYNYNVNLVYYNDQASSMGSICSAIGNNIKPYTSEFLSCQISSDNKGVLIGIMVNTEWARDDIRSAFEAALTAASLPLGDGTFYDLTSVLWRTASIPPGGNPQVRPRADTNKTSTPMAAENTSDISSPIRRIVPAFTPARIGSQYSLNTIVRVGNLILGPAGAAFQFANNFWSDTIMNNLGQRLSASGYSSIYIFPLGQGTSMMVNFDFGMNGNTLASITSEQWITIIGSLAMAIQGTPGVREITTTFVDAANVIRLSVYMRYNPGTN